MKIAVERSELVRVLSWLVKFTDPKSVSFGAKCVRFVADESGIRAMATDLEISGVMLVAGSQENPGIFACDGKALLERARLFPQKPIMIETRDSKVLLQSGTQRYSLMAVDGSELPKIPEPPKTKQTRIPASTLATLIRKVAHSISDDHTRANIHSALLECTERSLKMVATDGHRLTLDETPLVGGRAFEMLIMKPAVLLLAEQCEAAPEKANLEIATTKEQYFFDVAGVLMIAKIPQTDFPPYNQVIPAKPPKNVDVDRAEFVRALKATSLRLDGRIGIQFEKDLIRVSGESSDGEISSIELDVSSDVEQSAIGVCGKTLAEQLGTCTGATLRLGFDGVLDPVLVSSKQDPGFLAVHMPMRL
jgi:DNA polymerase-3 subunit beta